MGVELDLVVIVLTAMMLAVVNASGVAWLKVSGLALFFVVLFVIGAENRKVEEVFE